MDGVVIVFGMEVLVKGSIFSDGHGESFAGLRDEGNLGKGRLEIDKGKRSTQSETKTYHEGIQNNRTQEKRPP